MKLLIFLTLNILQQTSSKNLLYHQKCNKYYLYKTVLWLRTNTKSTTFCYLKHCTLYFSRKKKQEVRLKDANYIVALFQVYLTALSGKTIKTQNTDIIFSEALYLPHQTTYKTKPN